MSNLIKTSIYMCLSGYIAVINSMYFPFIPIISCQDDAISIPYKYTPLKLVHSIPPENTNLFSEAFSLGKFSDDSIAILDRKGQCIRVVDLRGKELATWGKEGRGNGEFLSPVAIAISSNDIVYVSDLRNMKIQLFNQNGKTLNSFMDYKGLICFNIGSSNLIYETTFALNNANDYLRIYDHMGKLLKRVQFPENSVYVEMKSGFFPRPLISSDRVFVINRNYTYIQMFSLSGEFIDEYEIIDARFRMRNICNRIRQQKSDLPIYGTEIIGGIAGGGGIQQLLNDYVVNININDKGLDFLRFNIKGQVVEDYYYRYPEIIEILDYTLIDKGDLFYIVCIVSKPYYRLLVLAPPRS